MQKNNFKINKLKNLLLTSFPFHDKIIKRIRMMNYLCLLNENDIKKLLEKCNLQFDVKTTEPVRFSEDKKMALIFCTKIMVSNEDKAKDEALKFMKAKFHLNNFNTGLFSLDPVVLLSEFELIDSINNQDYTDILFNTINEKLSDNIKMQKKYKKDFLKYHSHQEKEILKKQKKAQKNHIENER